MGSQRRRGFSETSGAKWKDSEVDMKTVTFGVSSIEELNRSVKAAFRGRRQPPRIDFVSTELMFKIMTAKRWEIVRAMAGAGPLSIREVARRVKRDVKAVHSDIHALLNCGVLDKDEHGRVIFPFERIRIDVLLEAA